MQDSDIASEVCGVVSVVVEVRSDDVKAEIQELAENALGINACSITQAKNGAPEIKCDSTLRAFFEKVDDDIQAIFARTSESRMKYEKLVNESQQLLRQISDTVFALRSDVRSVVDQVKNSRGSASCGTSQQCVREFRALLVKVIQVTEQRFYNASRDVKQLKLKLDALVAALDADKVIANDNVAALSASLGALSGAIDVRAGLVKKLVSSSEWQAHVKELARRVGLQEAGRVTVRLMDKGTESVDRMLDRVDEQAWFVVTLAMAVYESDIRDTLKKHFKEYFASMNSGDKNSDALLLRNLSVAFVFASCEQLIQASDDKPGTASTPITGRGGYLLYPMFTAAIRGLYEQLVGESDEQLDGERFRARLVAWVKSDSNELKQLLSDSAKELAHARYMVRHQTMNAVARADDALMKSLKEVAARQLVMAPGQTVKPAASKDGDGALVLIPYLGGPDGQRVPAASFRVEVNQVTLPTRGVIDNAIAAGIQGIR